MVPETVRCSVCCAEYADFKWRKLVLDRRIEPSEIRLLVSEWPEDVHIEVRSCSGCGHAIAAKRKMGASSVTEVADLVDDEHVGPGEAG